MRPMLRDGREMKQPAALIATNVVASWLLLPLVMRPAQIPPAADYLLLLMLLTVCLFIWPLTTLVLIGAKRSELLTGAGVLDLVAGSLLPALIGYEGVRLFVLGRLDRLNLVILHVGITGWWWLAWRGMFANGLDLMGGG